MDQSSGGDNLHNIEVEATKFGTGNQVVSRARANSQMSFEPINEENKNVELCRPTVELWKKRENRVVCLSGVLISKFQ